MLQLVACSAEALNYDLGLSPRAFVRIENFKMHLHGLETVLKNQLPLERKPPAKTLVSLFGF